MINQNFNTSTTQRETGRNRQRQRKTEINDILCVRVNR